MVSPSTRSTRARCPACSGAVPVFIAFHVEPRISALPIAPGPRVSMATAPSPMSESTTFVSFSLRRFITGGRTKKRRTSDTTVHVRICAQSGPPNPVATTSPSMNAPRPKKPTCIVVDAISIASSAKPARTQIHHTIFECRERSTRRIGLMRCASLFAVLLACSPLFAQERFTVGNAAAARGEKAYGSIEVPAGVDAALSIPVVIANGAKPGPVLALVSGAHGTEYASIIALEKVIARIDPAQLSGTVIIVPLVNINSFEQKVPHVNPVDKKSMNRFYPGKMDGTQTERAAYLITKEVVDKCDHLIDLHGGDLDESLRPYSYGTTTGNEKQDQMSRKMVLAFGLDHIIISADRPKDPQASRYLENTATTRGKASITAEAGHAGTVETDDLNALINGCLNVMHYLKMLPGQPAVVEHPVWIEKVITLASEQTGIFYPQVKRGTYVQQGMKVGYVTDYFGKTIFEARAPVSGIVLYVCAVPSMTKGATIANIGAVAP